MLHLGEQPTCDRGTRLTVGREGAGRGHGGGVCAASWLRMGRAVHIRLPPTVPLPPATLSFGCLSSEPELVPGLPDRGIQTQRRHTLR